MISHIGIHTSVDELFPPAVLRDALADIGSDVRIVETEDALSECDALVTFSYEEVFLSADLQWIHSIQAGVDRFPFDELADQNIRLMSSAGIHGDSVGEMVAGYMLMFARGLHIIPVVSSFTVSPRHEANTVENSYDRQYIHRTNQMRQEWAYPPWDAAFTLHNESPCVVGLGTLGRGIAMRADALGMDVTGVKKTPTPVDHIETVYPPADLHDALADTRFIALAIPLTNETASFIGEAEFKALRDDAYLINVARGDVVDQSALINTLESEALAGAALNVFETEPLPEDSPL